MDPSTPPQAVAAGGDGPSGSAYVDFKVDGSESARNVVFGGNVSAFHFPEASKGVQVVMVTRLDLGTKTVQFLFDVRLCLRLSVVQCLDPMARVGGCTPHDTGWVARAVWILRDRRVRNVHLPCLPRAHGP